MENCGKKGRKTSGVYKTTSPFSSLKRLSGLKVTVEPVNNRWIGSSTESRTKEFTSYFFYCGWSPQNITKSTYYVYTLTGRRSRTSFISELNNDYIKLSKMIVCGGSSLLYTVVTSYNSTLSFLYYILKSLNKTHQWILWYWTFHFNEKITVDRTLSIVFVPSQKHCHSWRICGLYYTGPYTVQKEKGKTSQYQWLRHCTHYI